MATAAELVVRVDDARGGPATDAVVTVVPHAAAEAPPAATGGSSIKIVDQRDETFIPYVEVFRPGDTVVFRNSDTTRHHVYSFSPSRTFEFVLKPGEGSDPIVLERSGIIAVGCNIHDPMIAYLFVSDADLIARTDASGIARFADVAAGEYAVRVWHPQLRPGRLPAAQRVSMPATDQSVARTFQLSLLPDPRTRPDPERAHY